MKKLYAFNQQEGAILSRLARSHPLAAQAGADLAGGGIQTTGIGAWILQTTTALTGATFSTNVTPGTGTVKLKKMGATYLEDHQSAASAVVSRTIKSLWPFAVPSGAHLLGVRTLDGTLWASEWLDKPNLFCRFHAGAAFTTSSANVSGTIDSYFGLGKDHASSAATFNNLALSSGYLFSGASGVYGLAYYLGSGTTWQIVQLECPTP